MYDPRWDDARERDDGRARVYGERDTRTAPAVPITVLSRRNRVRRKRLCSNRNRTGVQLLAAD